MKLTLERGVKSLIIENEQLIDMTKSKLIKESLLLIMLCTIVINIILLYFYNSPAGIIYTTISGFTVVTLYTSYLFTSKKSRIILYGILSATFLYALFLLYNQIILKNLQASLLLTASINLIFIVSSLGLIQKASIKFELVNLRFSILILFIIGAYNFFTLIAQEKTSSDYNVSFVIFLLIGSFAFLLNKLIALHFNRNIINDDETKNYKKTQHINLENREAIQLKIEMFFRENDAFTEPDFNFDDFVNAISFSKKEVSFYLNHHKKTSFYELLGEERAIYAAYQLKTNHLYTIEGIMQESGFKSHSSFMNYFKKVYGISPSEYRSKHLN